jgi:formate dehydrogenase subunit gamma
MLARGRVRQSPRSPTAANGRGIAHLNFGLKGWIMRIRLKPRSRRWTLSFLRRSTVLLGLFVVLSNIGYVLAQGLRDPQLLRTSIGVADFPRQVDFFIVMRESALIPSFGIALIVFVIIALGHFFLFGPKDMSIKNDQDAIPWWTLAERILHGIIAVAFIVLLVSGLAITFGRYFGGGTSTLVLRTSHEYAGFVFIPVLIILAMMWIPHALFRHYDLKWFAHAGGYLGYKEKLASGKFNAGQKQWYWFMTVFGLILAVTGVLLYFQWGSVYNMRTYLVLHLLSSIPLILMFVAHLYMTTLGTRGAFMGMINGRFSRTAAQAFHSEAPDLRKVQPAGSDD